jgi:hypothetical protein
MKDKRKQMSIVAFTDYHGPLARAKAKGQEHFDRYVERWGADEITPWVSLETLRSVSIQTSYEIELCMGNSKSLSNPKF